MTEEKPIIICGLVANGPYPFDDNIEGFCEDCNAAIIWRPHAPDGAHVCYPCALQRIELAKDEGEEVTYVTSKKTLEELRDLGWDVPARDQ